MSTPQVPQPPAVNTSVPSKSIFQSKTNWFGAIQIAAAVLDTFNQSGGVLPHGVAPYLGTTGIVTILLRFLTSQPVSILGSKES